MIKQNELPYRRIVLKLGTSLLTGGGDHLDQEVVASLVSQVALLHQRGAEVVIVSSGAMASGRYKLGLTSKVKGIPYKQVLAAVGQSRLMHLYEQLFDQHDINIAQALLTKNDLSDRSGYLNARNTLLALIELGVICIVNENDVVAVDEIKELKFGDNDNLSAMVANLIDADLLLILSDIAGLYTADPYRNPEARLISVVENITPEIESLVTDTHSKTGTGGMITKLQAAKLATSSGITVVIAGGREQEIIRRVAAGEAAGTRFLPIHTRIESRKRWMVSGLSTRGKLIVDDGAVRALSRQNRSLLAAGIREVEGDFQRGDIVNIYDATGNRLGCGISSYCSADIAVIKGAQSAKIVALLGYDYGPEVVHRNNLVVL